MINKTLHEKAFEKVVMNPGDLLYLPRGTVHYTEPSGDIGAAHITFGVDSGAAAWSEVGKVVFPAPHVLNAVNPEAAVYVSIYLGCSQSSDGEASGAVLGDPGGKRCTHAVACTQTDMKSMLLQVFRLQICTQRRVPCSATSSISALQVLDTIDVPWLIHLPLRRVSQIPENRARLCRRAPKSGELTYEKAFGLGGCMKPGSWHCRPK